MMKRILNVLVWVLFASLLPLSVYAAAFVWGVGGTNNTNYSANSLIASNGSNQFIATSTQPLTVGSIVATTTATSTFSGGITALGLSSTNGITVTGNGTSTFNNGLVLTKGCIFQNGACLSAGGTGTVTNVATGNQLTGGPITTTGTISLLSSIQLFSASSTLLSATSTIYVGSTATTTIVGNNATSTFAGGIAVANGGGLASDHGLTITGGSLICTTCIPNTSLANSTISGISLGGTLGALTATNGSITFSGSYDGSVARTLGINLSNTNTWAVHQIFTSTFTSDATTTNATTTGTLAIPFSATSPAIGGPGQIAVETTVASSSLHYHDGTANRALYPTNDSSMVLASSTLLYYNPAFGTTGSTTLVIRNPIHPTTVTNLYCRTDGGTVNVEVGNGTATSTIAVCTTTGKNVPLSSNNTLTARQSLYITVGNSGTGFNYVTPTLTLRQDSD